ncbi:MAG TPA: amidohydrolase family protein [Chthonomonadaceae bacterium]|nr:amidohydrolase family protein [Chthonomonadaceae bacterium]
MIIDGMYHLEMCGSYWDGLFEEVLEYYEAARIDQGVVTTTWTPSRESNDRTRAACVKYPDRFYAYGHVRPEDDWKGELKRITKEFGWHGLKLHQGELKQAGSDMAATTREILEYGAALGIRVVKIHLVDYDAIETLTCEFPHVTWILPHMGCWGRWKEMPRYCDLARERANVYLDTCAVDAYFDFGTAFERAGFDKVTFATDGPMFSPLVEKAKVDTLRLPTPYRTPCLTDEQYGMIMGGNMARLLKLL